MSRNHERDMRERAERDEKILSTAFPIFAEKGIDPVSMNEIAEACSIGVATLYRHYRTKSDLVIAISARTWNDFIRVNAQRHPVSDLSAAEEFDFFLDTFVVLYRNHRDILKFNHYFNGFIEKANVTPEQMDAFSGVIENIAGRFHRIRVKAEADGTVRTDITEEEMFSAVLHLMLAAVTRYAVGLVYQKSNAEKELLLLKKMLFREYGTH